MASNKTPSATDTEHELREALDKASAELSEIQTRAADHRDQIATKREYLRRRTVDHPEDFDSTGEPKKDTGAAKLASEIHKLVEQDKFNQLIHGAEQRLREAESKLAVHRRDHARELFAEMRPEAEAAVDAWVAWVEQGQEHYRRLAELTEPVVVSATTGRSSRVPVPILRGALMRSTPSRSTPAKAFRPLHAGGLAPAVEVVVRGISDDCALHDSLVAQFAYPAESLNPGFVEASSRGRNVAA
jgi:hypothetical protein